MKWKKFFLLSSFLVTTLIALCQNLEQSAADAYRWELSNNYTEAKKLWERILFFTPFEKRKEPLQQTAECCLILHQYDSAFLLFAQADAHCSTDAEKNENTLNKVRCRLFSHQYQEAAFLLLNMSDSLPQQQKSAKNFYMGIARFGLQEYEESERYFLLSMPEAGDSVITEFHQLFIRVKKKKISPSLARIFSIALPGSGQFYAGDFKNGTNSLLLVSATGAVLYYVAVAYSPLLAAVSISPWFLRYYIGGFQRAYAIALKKNNSRRDEVYHRILKLAEKQNPTQ